ncbi:MAG: transposase [Acetobacteraceae bacterium]
MTACYQISALLRGRTPRLHFEESKRGRQYPFSAWVSHNYKPHGTTTLFAAPEVVTGKVLAVHSKHRRRVEFLGFMDRVAAVNPERELQVLPDHLSTNKKNERWLERHPNVHFHFTPTRPSWLNQVETWFSILQRRSLTGASFAALARLQEHVDAFVTPTATLPDAHLDQERVYRRRFNNRRISQV